MGALLQRAGKGVWDVLCCGTCQRKGSLDSSTAPLLHGELPRT